MKNENPGQLPLGMVVVVLIGFFTILFILHYMGEEVQPPNLLVTP